MRALLAFALVATLALPSALARSDDGTAPPQPDNASVDDLPVADPVGEEESTETGAGLGYGFGVLVGTIAFLGLLGFLSYRYSHRKR